MRKNLDRVRRSSVQSLGRQLSLALLVVILQPVALSVHGSATAAAGSPAPVTAWTRYHYDPSNNALIAEPHRAAVSWRSPVVQDKIRAVSIVGETVYAIGAGKAHAVYALNRTTGKPLWMTPLDNVIMSQAIVAGGRVFVGTGNNYMRAAPAPDYRTVMRGTGFNSIYALDAASGRIVWRLLLQGEAMPTPIYRDGVLYWVTGDRRFLAIDAASGRIAWSLQIPSYMSMASIAEDGNLLIFGGAHPYAEYAVDLTTRRVAWRHQFSTFKGLPVTGAIDDCSPAAYQHTVFCTGTASANPTPNGGDPIRQFAWALDTRSGSLLWAYDQGAGKLPNNFAAGVPIAIGGVVYVESPGNKGLQALDAGTGRLLWQATLKAADSSSSVLDGANVFIGDNAGTLYEFDARSGRLLHRMLLGGGVSNLGMVLDSGTLYVPNALGGVVDAIPERVLDAAPTLEVSQPQGVAVSQCSKPADCG